MIDFSSLNGITIPEGKVIKIDAGGKTLWREAKYRYVSLGDSIAVGHSIDYNWEQNYGYHTQYGENGNTSTKIVTGSYTDLIGKELENTYGAGCVSTKSFAHSGDRVNDLIGKLDHAVVRNTIKNADLVTVCIGANDILGPALSKLEDYFDIGDAALDELAIQIEARLVSLNDDNNSTSYRALFNKLAAINPNAKYVFTNIYNPYKYLWIDEGHGGFFEPILDLVNSPIDLPLVNIPSFIKDSFLGTPAVKLLYSRVNGLGDWAEKYISRLNQVLQSSISRYQTVNRNFILTDVKQLFEVFPDRPYAATKNYNDLISVEYTRNYNTATMDWGRLWKGSNAGTWWGDLIWKYFVAGSLDINGLAADIVQQTIEKVIVPDIDPHPEAYGHYVMKRSFADALGWQSLDRYTITYVANGGTGSAANQVVLGVDGLPSFIYLKSLSFTPATGYYYTGWSTSANGGIAYSNAQYISINYNLTLYAQWSNIYILTYKNTNASNFYSDSETGYQQCYELRVNGVYVANGYGLNDKGDLGAFNNGPAYIPLAYGATIEVACTYYINDDKYLFWDAYKSASVDIYDASGNTLADNSSKRPSGYYPYGSSDSLTYPNGAVSGVAYYKFTLKGDTTIDMVAKTNAPALYNKEAYWDCYITT